MFASVTNSLWGTSTDRKSTDSRQQNNSSTSSASLAMSPLSFDGWHLEWEDARVGFEHLFDDRFEEAERVLGLRAKESPIHAVGYALTAFIDAVLGFEERVITEALQRLQAAETLATDRARRIRKDNTNASVVKSAVVFDVLAADCTLLASCLLFMRESIVEYAKGAYKLRNAYKMYCACRTAAYGEQADSEDEYGNEGKDEDIDGVKQQKNIDQAGMVVEPVKPVKGSSWFNRQRSKSSSSTRSISSRRSSQGAEQMIELTTNSSTTTTLITKQSSTTTTETDTETTIIAMDMLALGDAPSSNTDVADELISAGVSFGVGFFRLALSMLPPRALKVLSAFGLRGNRTQGLELLRRASNRNTDMHTPFAALTLLGYHTGLNSFASFAPSLENNLKEAGELITRMRDRYPNGRLWRLMEGKLCRVRSDLPRAAELFHREHVPDDGTPATRWAQLEHLMDYEFAWCSILIGNYQMGGDLFGSLTTSTNWSRAFYAYLQTVCLFAVGDTEQAINVLALVPSLLKKRFGGRLIPAEQYVLRKHKQIMDNPPPANKPWRNLVLELVYIWNGFHQLDTNSRAQALEHLKEAESAARTSDEKTVIRVALSSLLRENGDLDAATEMLDHIDENIKDDRYAVIFSWYERAVIACYRANNASSSSANQQWTEVELWLKRATDADGYDFDNRLHLRAQLLRSGITEAQALQ
ncbi:hypothetical protein BDF19DRAFT_235004 [Syncephalis fuscata]|nr:hypothetical protein BDF19DRAFT_235004 [Syncephalis fuscata]